MQSNFFENLSIEAMEISMRMTPQDVIFGSEPLLWIPRGSKPPPPLLLPHDVLQYAFPFWRHEFFLEYPYKANQ